MYPVWFFIKKCGNSAFNIFELKVLTSSANDIVRELNMKKTTCVLEK